jgi:3-phosphoshikimate 1-carboxyvinyltransferase
LTSMRSLLRVAGSVTVPGDKSISHRALILSALADGVSHLRGVLQSADVNSTATCLRRLGFRIPELTAEMSIAGSGVRLEKAPSELLDCGNSGTTARLLMGVCAASPISATFVGDASLSRRPMRRVTVPLEAMGAWIDSGGRDGLPLTVHGALHPHPVEWKPSVASAQVKSALLLAGVCGQVPVGVWEPIATRDHTERMLAAQGVRVSREEGWVRLELPSRSLDPLDIDIPGDPSSAAYFLALAALADCGSLRVEGVCLNPGRTGFLRVLERMGAALRISGVREEANEPVGDLELCSGQQLRGVEVRPEEVPSMIDELPLLACMAARASGETVVRGASELRVKESDRIASVVANLRLLGVEAEELPDGFRVLGTERALQGSVRAEGDHRLAMAFGILGMTKGVSLVVDNPDCVSVSFPRFWEELQRCVA